MKLIIITPNKMNKLNIKHKKTIKNDNNIFTQFINIKPFVKLPIEIIKYIMKYIDVDPIITLFKEIHIELRYVVYHPHRICYMLENYYDNDIDKIFDTFGY